MLVLTVIACVSGGLIGFILPRESGVGAPPQNGGQKASAAAAKAADNNESEGRSLKLKELPPIVTNLGDPSSAWVRLQAAIVYDPASTSDIEILSSQIRSDIVGFLRATSLSSVQGAEGLRRLHEDLSDRATVRSGNRVKEFIIETVVFQ
jgi:flagellar basal body-associated protein FliL